ncbi:phospholipase-like protein [Tanacetum coccineum]
MLEEANGRKSIDFSKSSHMKVATEKCRTNKRRYVDVLWPPIEENTAEKVVSMDRLEKQNNVLDEFMIQMCLNLKPWNRDSLIGLDDERLGWLVDDHIKLWVWYMWHFRQSCDDWSMVRCYFLTLLLQDSMPLFYATDKIYPLAWRDVEQFRIQSRNVTFYDSQKTYDPEFHPWYVKMRSCLESKLPVMLQQTGVFASKGIDPTSYIIKFTNAQNVLKQGGVFGDCGVFVCLFLYSSWDPIGC